MTLNDKVRPALVLSGGGIKAAAFHVGVCLALREIGFQFAGGTSQEVQSKYLEDKMTFKTYVGSSAGAIVASFLACGYSVDAIVDAFMRGQALTGGLRVQPSEDEYLKPIRYRDIFGLNISGRYSSKIVSRFFDKGPVLWGGVEAILKRGLKVNGIFSMGNLEKYLSENFCGKNNFSTLGVELFIAATELNHSRKIIFSNKKNSSGDEQTKYSTDAKVSEAVAASASLPPVFAPYKIINAEGKGVFYFDGEIRDTLSTHVAADNGNDLVIASYSMQPYHQSKDMGSLHQYGVAAIVNQAINQMVQQKIETHRQYKKRIEKVIDRLNSELKQLKLSREKTEEILNIVAECADYKRGVEYIYIHPRSEDHNIFFADHFSLSPEILSKITHAGFKSAMRALRKYRR